MRNNPKPLDIDNVPLEGANLIEASAGTGKTFAITNLFVRLLTEKQLKVSEILVVTFTESATQELKDRIRKNISAALLIAEGDRTAEPDDVVGRIIEKNLKTKPKELITAILKRAMAEFDEASVFTIHGFCKRLLADSSFETLTLFDTEIVTEQSSFINETVLDFWRLTFSARPSLFSAMAAKNKIGVEDLRKLAAEIVNKPLMKIIPCPVEASFEEADTLFEQLAEEFKKSGTDIRNILCSSKSLSRDKTKGYPIEKIDDYLERLEFLFNRVPSSGSLEGINYFSRGSIEKCLSKKSKEPSPEHAFFDLCEAFCGVEKRLFMKIKLDFAAYFKSEFYIRKKTRNIQGFDDLLLNVYHVLSSEKGSPLVNHTRKIYSAAMIDEFQDTDPVQYYIFDTLFRTDDHTLFMIGDPKQSIYGFRGADVFAYFDAAARTDPDRKFTLEKNFRSETGCVEGVNSLFSRKPDIFALEEKLLFTPVSPAPASKGNRRKFKIAESGTGGIVLWRYCAEGGKQLNKEAARSQAVRDTVREAAALLEKACLGDEPVKPSDIAVLVTRNQDANLFIDHFTNLNIPAVLKKTGSVFKSDQAKELALLLQAFACPTDRKRVFTALSTNIIGENAKTLDQFLTDESETVAYEEHVKRFVKYGGIWRSGEFMKMFRKFTGDYHVRSQLLKFTDGERRLTNLFHLAEILHKVCFENRLGFESLLDWLNSRILETGMTEETEEEELRLERDDEAIQILTVHKSKGLEYPIVFLPFMWQSGLEVRGELFFHKDGSLFLDIGSDDEQQNTTLAEREILSEQMRNLYVAITRASNRCYMVCGDIGRDSNVLKYLFSSAETENSEGDTSLQGVICPEPDTADPKPYASLSNIHKDLCLKTCQAEGSLADNFGVCSFSRISASAYLEIRDKAESEEDVLDEPVCDIHLDVPGVEPEGFFAFPKGASAGSCIHEIFEKIDFSLTNPEAARELIGKTLKKYAFAQDNGNNTVDTLFEMVKEVLNTPLLTENRGLCLSNISPEKRIHELNFFHPLKLIEPETLSAVFNPVSLMFKRFPEKIEGLTFSPVHGFMQGFVDLIFYFENRYYILDWKTNHLGNSFTDYMPEKLKKPMEDSLYILQYYIYTAAVNRYLQLRIKDYSYEENFGGIFYLFLRGVNPRMPGSGIYYDMPLAEVIKGLSSLADSFT